MSTAPPVSALARLVTSILRVSPPSVVIAGALERQRAHLVSMQRPPGQELSELLAPTKQSKVILAP